MHPQVGDPQGQLGGLRDALRWTVVLLAVAG